ncbi:hypothetical protein Pcinc_044208 [Petrolisthes cinctipes]|uniref:Uncharacterized protein n=1 Tax=Petrolisthes cinctipes TaxID=88211 RepID=A0AAE1BE97_PETCI|nr:hypothetical protein Pcinc_044208 [Petrolisthes cinctipes]
MISGRVSGGERRLWNSGVKEWIELVVERSVEQVVEEVSGVSGRVSGVSGGGVDRVSGGGGVEEVEWIVLVEELVMLVEEVVVLVEVEWIELVVVEEWKRWSG